ncbi:hypothetical protein [Streptomyces sp. NPDC059009]|uniref:hypothetical protein n=1 Tax=Streptomyces sp. NPDC059009 TaxID=3346694 RepID=UPI0036A9F6B3
MDTRRESRDSDARGPEVCDRYWARERRGAFGYAALLFVLLLAIDAAADLMTAARAGLWAGLSVLLLLVLLPARVSAGEGWLASRKLLRERYVRTDELVSVRCLDGVAQRLVLRDTTGGRVELDPQVLVSNPDLWRRLDDDAHTAAERGTLACGATALRQLADRVDRETAMTVFKVSGLE